MMPLRISRRWAHTAPVSATTHRRPLGAHDKPPPWTPTLMRTTRLALDPSEHRFLEERYTIAPTFGGDAPVASDDDPHSRGGDGGGQGAVPYPSPQSQSQSQQQQARTQRGSSPDLAPRGVARAAASPTTPGWRLTGIAAR